MNTPQIKALICDNSASVGTSIASSLAEHSIYAYTRSNNESAVMNSVISEAPDVVICNLTLKDTDVVTLMRKIRETVSDAPSFIVVCDLYNAFIEKQVLANGASYFIAEPINTDELAEAVMAVARRNVAPSCHDPEILVTDTIKKICIPANLKGYRYIRSCVLECLRDKSLLDNITKRLYPVIAEKYSATPSRVERAIRTAIETAWERADKLSIRNVLGYDNSFFGVRPTNSEFIAMLTDKIQLQMRNRIYGQNTCDRISFTGNTCESSRAVL